MLNIFIQNIKKIYCCIKKYSILNSSGVFPIICKLLKFNDKISVA